MDTAIESSFWKEEPLSPVYSGLEYQADVWKLFEEDVAKQPQKPKSDPLDSLGSRGQWLPDSPGDSQDPLEVLSFDVGQKTRAQLASELLQDLDEVFIKDETFGDPWYEQKTDLPMFDELPSPTPSLGKEESLVGAAPRPFSGLSLSMPLNGYVTATPATGFTAPADPSAVLVPLSTVPQQSPIAEGLQALHQPAVNNAGLLAVVQLQLPLIPPQLQPLPVVHPDQHLQHLAAIHDAQPIPSIHDTQQLLREFDFVFGKVEQSLGGALTPPQSPPHQQFPPGLQYQLQGPPGPQAQAVETPSADDFAALTPSQQQQQLIREVDELVYTRIQQDACASGSEEALTQLSSFAPPSPCTSSNSSSCSFSSDSPAPASPETETDDPEWVPGSADSPDDELRVDKASKAGPVRKRGSKRAPKPYSHEDKRNRKKEQNKNAATRYRMKKKAEVEEILGEENGLRVKNNELRNKVTDLSQEIRYLKNLMREVFVRRGLLK